MDVDLSDLNAFLAVASAKGFREGARATGRSASGLSESIRRLETQLGVRLLNRTTRSVLPTELGLQLISRLRPALSEVQSALDVVSGIGERAAGTLRLNVPVSAARLVLPAIVPQFLAAYPEIQLEIFAEENFVDILAAGCDAGIRYEERLEQDMIAVPIGPRVQRFATAASPDYLNRRGRPQHPRELLQHACLRGRFSGRAPLPWEYRRGDEVMRVDPSGPLIVQLGAATDLIVDAAIAGAGIITLFEDWLRPHFNSGVLEPVLEPWWESFSGPFLYYPGRRLLPAPLRALVEFIKSPAMQLRAMTPIIGV